MAKTIDAAKREAGKTSAKKNNTNPYMVADIGKMWLQMERNTPDKGGCLIKIGIDGIDPELKRLRDFADNEHGVDIDMDELMDLGYCEASVEPKVFDAIRKWIEQNTNWFNG